jgi:hypothetical protein
VSTFNSVMQDLLLSQRTVIGLPSIKFFEPKRTFCRLMTDRYLVREVPIYDVGAGVGHVSSQLSREGLMLIPIDINVRCQTEAHVLIGNGVNFPFERHSVVMICRPCHGPTTEFYIKNAISRRVSEILYVGKPANFKGACGHYHHRFNRIMTNAGKERESVYLLEVK